MWSRPPSMPWCSCVIVPKSRPLAASRYRSYIDGRRKESDDAPSVLPVGDLHTGKAQEGDQGIGLYQAQSSGGTRGYCVRPWHGQGCAAPGADRSVRPPKEHKKRVGPTNRAGGERGKDGKKKFLFKGAPKSENREK